MEQSGDQNNSDQDRDRDQDRAGDYLVLLNRHEKHLSAYVHTLVNDRADAEDILQACRLTMWKKFDQFEPGTNFPAWARRIALHQVLNYRRSQSRKPVYATDPEFIESIAGEIDRQSDRQVDRAEALQACLKKLPAAQRRTVLLRYYDGCEVEEIAQQTSRSVAAVYRVLSRIRASLNDCIQQQMEGAARG